MTKRLRFKQTISLQDRLELFAKGIRDQARGVPQGLERDGLLMRARQADIAAHLNQWANSPGLQRPKK